MRDFQGILRAFKSYALNIQLLAELLRGYELLPTSIPSLLVFERCLRALTDRKYSKVIGCETSPVLYYWPTLAIVTQRRGVATVTLQPTSQSA